MPCGPWLVTGRAALLECRLVSVGLLPLVRLIGVASQAYRHGVRLRESWRISGVRIVTVSAFARRARMLNLRLFNLFRLVGVASEAELFRRRRDQDNLAILRWGVAGITLATREWRMRELCHQFLAGRLVRIVTGQAIGGAKGLTLVRLDQGRILRIMAINAQRRSILCQMEVKFAVAASPRLMCDVAGVATHIQRRVATAFFRNIDADFMTTQTDI